MVVLNKIQQEKYEEIIKTLKSKSIKITDIRSNVIKILVVSEHVNMQQLTNSLEEISDSVNLTSVYNTIDLLLEEHIIFSNVFDGKNIQYELSTNKSIHIKCDVCKSVEHITEIELEKCKLNEMQEIMSNRNLRLEHIKIELHTICKNCSSASSK